MVCITQTAHFTSRVHRFKAERKQNAEECWGIVDHFSTDFDRLPLLDAAPTFGDDGRAFDPSIGRWYRVEDSYPRKVTIAVAELGELAALIEQMTAELAITFTVERFFWTENTLAQWVLAEEMRDGRTSDQAG